MAKIGKERIGEYLKGALRLLDENGGQLPSKEMFRRLEPRLKLTDYELEPYKKTGYIRWESIVHFYSIDVTKAGWLRKKNGVWYITPEGREALSYPAREFIEEASRRYKEWRAMTQKLDLNGVTDDLTSIPDRDYSILYERSLGDARQELRRYINGKDPYEFQDIVAALLRAMGYHTPFVAPKGKDGGQDIIAYKDPFGAEVPRIRVQVKHREQKATNQEVNMLIGILRDGDIGLFVSTSGFTSEATNVFRTSHKHVESMDLDALLQLWERYYSAMSDDDKRLLPLKTVAFLAPADN